ncbi:MAG: hypothetical protein IKE70_01335 [Bacilli bacterium]|nr:hypothetical protein [Bacilli bacterium]
MWNSLRKSLEIDTIYSMNSFIYTIGKLPILRDLFTNDIYKNTSSKKVLGFFGVIFSLLKKLLYKYIYFYIIYYVSSNLLKNHPDKAFIHIYCILTIIGMFIHNRILDPSKKKYFSLILFNMEDTHFLKATILWNQFTLLFWNSIFLFYFSNLLKISFDVTTLLILFSFFIRLIGEEGLILFYKKYHYMFYNNTILYFSIIIPIFLCSFLPLINIYLTSITLLICTIISIILGFLSFILLWNIKDYKKMYKEISHNTNPMNQKNNKDYMRQSMVEVRDKDKWIHSKKLEGKEGFHYLNTIFNERHKEILFRSIKRYSILLIIFYIGVIYCIMNNLYKKEINNILNIHILWLPLVMFFLNRGSIITQAMFYNCDHAFLKYQFYREPRNLLRLFKIRMITLIKLNLLPAIIMVIGNTIIYSLTNRENLIGISIGMILSLNIFFSIHYLVIYYLLQPYNKDMEMKSIPYLIVSFLTYLISFIITLTNLSPILLMSGIIVFTIVYIPISIHLVKKYGPSTFRIH